MKLNKNQIIVIILAILVIMLIIAAYAFYSQKKEQQLESLAKCLTQNDIKFYGSLECTHCETQKQMFKGGLKYLSYVECGSLANMNQVCLDANITGTPTWIFPSGNRLEGIQTIRLLSELSGCNI